MDATGKPTVPRVSVCMPASRPSPWFLEALDSVLSQEMADLEVVVTDDSGGRLEELVRSRGDARVVYRRNAERLGLAGNHCRALDLASGGVIAFLHDDDTWSSDYLTKALDVLDADKRVGLVLVGMLEVDRSGDVLGVRSSSMPEGRQSDPLGWFLRREFRGLIPSASVFRREALTANPRPWPDVVAGDLTMYLDCVQDGWDVHHLPEPLVRYRIHEGQTTMDRLSVLTAMVAVFGGYSFPEPRHERHRLRRVASACVGRAAARLYAGDARGARADVLRAWRVPTWERWAVGLLVLGLSIFPPAVYRSVERSFRATRALLQRSSSGLPPCHGT